MFKALAAGVGWLPLLHRPSWEGSIEAVFRTSLCLCGPRQALVHLHTGSYLVSPCSMRTAEAWAPLIAGGHFLPGMPVRKEGDRLWIGDHPGLCTASVTSYRSPSAPPGPLDPAAVNLARQLCQQRTGLDTLPGARARVDALRQAWRTRQRQPLLASMQQLIGLGPGLTPSGDDFVVGCLKGVWLAGGLAGDTETGWSDTFDALGRALLPHIETLTTRVGAAFIRYALGGEFAEVLDRAAAALLAPAPRQAVTLALRQLLAQGATSGRDTLQGLLCGLDASVEAWRLENA